MRSRQPGLDPVHTHRLGRVGLERIVGGCHIAAQPVFDGPITGQEGSRPSRITSLSVACSPAATLALTASAIGFGSVMLNCWVERVVTWETVSKIKSYPIPAKCVCLNRMASVGTPIQGCMLKVATGIRAKSTYLQRSSAFPRRWVSA